MIPDESLSTDVHSAPFIPPRARMKEPLEDYELGGQGINDSSAGLQVHVWRGRYLDGSIVLDVPGVVGPQAVLTAEHVTEFTFTFDQNMQPAIAYMVGDETAHFNWFDGTLPGFATLDLPAGTITPRCSLDDKRHASGTLAGGSDIILTYMRDGSLYFRAQRERYDVERELATDLDNFQLGQFGMNRGLRMQWQLVPIPIEDQ